MVAVFFFKWLQGLAWQSTCYYCANTIGICYEGGGDVINAVTISPLQYGKSLQRRFKKIIIFQPVIIEAH
jgi:hypothetical protein